MRSTLPLLALEIGADERTLRRAVSRGTVRSRRPGARKLTLSPGEREYLRGHWPLLSVLSRALRTEPSVRLAVLFGSAARGDDGPGADLDLLVALREDSPRAANAVALRLEHAAGRQVDLALLIAVHDRSPLLLLQALDEGRVLVDRDGLWRDLVAPRDRVRAAADRAVQRDRDAAAAAVSDLLEP
jgi:predicted nucleotidyltransferase